MSNNQDSVARAVLELPFHKYLGIELIDAERPELGIELTVDEHVLNAVGVLHGGVFPACLDVAAYLAVLPRLRPGQHATTVSATSSIMRSARAGDRVRFVGTALRTGSTLAFAAAEAIRDDQVIASCQLTKAIVAAPQ